MSSKKKPKRWEVCFLLRDVFLQSSLRIGQIIVDPLGALGYRAEADVVAHVVREKGGHATDEFVEALRYGCGDSQVEEDARLAAALVAGTSYNPARFFGYVVVPKRGKQVHAKLLPLRRRRVLRLGPGNTGPEYESQLATLHTKAKANPHAALYLKVLNDAAADDDTEMALLKTCLVFDLVSRHWEIAPVPEDDRHANSLARRLERMFADMSVSTAVKQLGVTNLSPADRGIHNVIADCRNSLSHEGTISGNWKPYLEQIRPHAVKVSDVLLEFAFIALRFYMNKKLADPDSA